MTVASNYARLERSCRAVILWFTVLPFCFGTATVYEMFSKFISICLKSSQLKSIVTFFVVVSYQVLRFTTLSLFELLYSEKNKQSFFFIALLEIIENSSWVFFCSTFV